MLRPSCSGRLVPCDSENLADWMMIHAAIVVAVIVDGAVVVVVIVDDAVVVISADVDDAGD